MDRQTRLMEALARRNDNGNGNGQGNKMAQFMRLRPPTFDSCEDDPLVADDWLRSITKKLNAIRATDEEKVLLATHQLVGATGEWWENYQDAVDEPEAIT
jgi:lysophospholipase L1-like esterase